MATTYADRDLARVETTGSIVEAAGGIAVIVLSIIGLTRIDAGALTSIAVIILGAAMLAEGGSIATEFSKLLNLNGSTLSGVEMGGGMLSEIVVGAGVLVLGVLSLLGVSATTLVPVAVLASGALLLISAPSVQRMNEVRLEASSLAAPGQRLMQTAGSAAAGLQVLAGLAAIVLGILALTTTGTATTGREAMFALIGLLVLGSSMLISASTVTGNMMRLFHH
ncbi:MAG: hypothetical protein JSR55_08625 [Proteobacteria bacterium]|nr:hypothetical protein [Pseudomonadota bacterium]